MLKQVRRRWIARSFPMAAALLLLLAGGAGGEVQHLRHHLEGCPGDVPHGSSDGPWDAHGVCVACQIFHHGWVDFSPSLDVVAAEGTSDHPQAAQAALPARLDSALPSVRGPPSSFSL